MFTWRNKIKLLISIFLAYYLAKLFSGSVFLANTPMINRRFITFMVSKLRHPSRTISFQEFKRSMQPILVISPKSLRKLVQKANKQIAPGVYAGEDGKKSIMVIYASQVRSLKTKK